MEKAKGRITEDRDKCSFHT